MWGGTLVDCSSTHFNVPKKCWSGVLSQSYENQKNQQPQLKTSTTQEYYQSQPFTIAISTTQD